jgi:predicted dehydrogenase
MPDQVLADRPIEFGVVGLGYWGPNLLRVLGDDPGVSVRWVCDLDPARLTRFQRRHPTAQVTVDVREVLADPHVDAVVIATPIFTHFDLAAASLRAGKHTFVEKPMASSAVLADELRSLARIHERIVMCGHTFLYSPSVRMLKRMLDDRTLGDVFFVSSSRVNLGLHQRDVSVVWDLAPHDFSILRYWLDETPLTIRAIGRDSIVPGIADVAFITMTFPSGIVCNVELSWLAPSKLRRTVVVGSDKMVVYDDGDAEPIRLFDHGVIYRDPETFGQYHLSYRTGDILSPKVDSYEPLSAELADLGRAIRSGDSMTWQAELARDVVLMTEAADRSLKNGGTEVDVQALGGRAPRTASRVRARSREPAA